ncbi:hypothetical protein KSF78_0001542 [Schistosoma japonicum]|nr:hypothetical protein KSF78_0001542 [Schistosoma japonicum]
MHCMSNFCRQKHDLFCITVIFDPEKLLQHPYFICPLPSYYRAPDHSECYLGLSIRKTIR